MSKTKEAFTNNDILVKCLGVALKEKRTTIKEVKSIEKQLKREFPYVEYDFSSLYGKKAKEVLPEEPDEVEDEDETEDDE